MTPSRRAKIQKVLALAKDNPNAHEAAVALATAERMLEEEGLTVETFQNPPRTHTPSHSGTTKRSGAYTVDWGATPQGWGWGAPPPRPRPTETYQGVTLTRRNDTVKHATGYKHVPEGYDIKAYRHPRGSHWDVYVTKRYSLTPIGTTSSLASVAIFVGWLDTLDWGKIKAEHPEVWPRKEPRRTTLRTEEGSTTVTGYHRLPVGWVIETSRSVRTMGHGVYAVGPGVCHRVGTWSFRQQVEAKDALPAFEAWLDTLDWGFLP